MYVHRSLHVLRIPLGGNWGIRGLGKGEFSLCALHVSWRSGRGRGAGRGNIITHGIPWKKAQIWETEESNEKTIKKRKNGARMIFTQRQIESCCDPPPQFLQWFSTNLKDKDQKGQQGRQGSAVASLTPTRALPHHVPLSFSTFQPNYTSFLSSSVPCSLLPKAQASWSSVLEKSEAGNGDRQFIEHRDL